MADQLSRPVVPTRRTVLGSIGATVGGLALARGVDAGETTSDIVLRNDDGCVEVTPFAGEEPVEQFYDYRIPERYVSDENDGYDPGSGPYYSSVGTEEIQRDGASLLCLYDGPEGLSLVVVHDSLDTGPSDGGSATFEFEGLPEDGTWVVKDDYIIDPDTGDFISNNYDRWRLDEEPQVVDWTWDAEATDGGAFRGLQGEFSVTIDPAFNEQATLYDQHYEGTVESWELVVPDGDGVERVSLNMTSPIIIETGTCDDRAKKPKTAPRVKTVEFKDCSEVWIVFEKSFDRIADCAIKTTTGWHKVEITKDDLQRVPGQYGDHPLYKGRTSGSEKILAAKTPAGRADNDHECARKHDDDGGGDDDKDRDDKDRDDGGGGRGGGGGGGRGGGGGGGRGGGGRGS